ncbi:electron transfer flavoprotein subunit alpha [Moniliophthora roreri MCA 2997]|uniref:Probable electron transfer flavoprotein subunit alpha n=2 Tax=Moniliophthora roreri TaxID=221103 RepID=V2YY60_MONRO|nr:electron transfer flavoprotein subunit alpha [Moniliophthora roreri MCA 2997]KAI3618620.1 electron transfer flavoprotein subunit alpha [Moniliophthora roreri]
MLLSTGRRLLVCRSFLRQYATASSPNTLIFIEHRQGAIEPGSLSALTAAEQLGGKVTGLVVGGSDQVPEVVEKIKKLKGLTSLLHSTSELYAQPLPETISPLLEKILSESQYTHVVSAPSSFAKSLLPRVAAKLDVPSVSEITSLEHDSSSNTTTFTRPIYAGNAISTVRLSSAIPVKFFTVRGTSFNAAPTEDGKDIEVKAVDPVNVADLPTRHVKTQLAKSDRPDLSVASRVVSGGRPLKNAETFAATLYPLADVLGAAVGASRAAVDAGYADNSLQVGQTGKAVAPELYIALGISGAIQHLAGMKDSKLIVAVNKDPDAPIFQVADAGLVGDLYEVVPQLIEKLKQ